MRIVRTMLIFVCLSAAIAAQASASYQMDYLGFLPGDGYSEALRINHAGEVLGYSASSNEVPNGGGDPFLWNHTSGMVNMRVDNQFDYVGGINNNGQVSGAAYPGYGPSAAVLRQADGKLLPLDPIAAGAYGTYTRAINDDGWIVGMSGNYAVVWQGTATAQMIGGTPGSESYATDINNNGSATWVESLYDANHQWLGTRSYVWNQGTNTLLQSLNAAVDCQAEALNDSGTIVGTSGDHAVVWDTTGNIILDLGIGTACGINARGQIVGTSGDHGVLWNPDGSVAADLGASAIAFDINDSGTIAGSAVYDQYGNREAVLWQPVPEPSSLLTLTALLVPVAGLAMRRRS